MRRIALLLMAFLVISSCPTSLSVVCEATSIGGGDLHLETSEEWSSEGETWIQSVCSADVDNDGDVEVVTVGACEQKGELLGQMKIWNYDGSVLNLEKSETVESGITGWGRGIQDCNIADVDNDGDLEIVTTGDLLDGGIRTAQLMIWSWDGSTLTLEKSTSWVTGSIARVMGVTIDDVDKDGQVEIVTTGEANSWSSIEAQLRIWNWDGASLTLEKSHEWQSGGGHTRAYPVTTKDVDGNGDIEIIAGGGSITSGGPWSRGQGILWIFRWNGATLTLEREEWLAGEKWYQNLPDISFGDVDNDGVAEICTVSQAFDNYGSSVESACVRVWDWHGSTLTLEREQLWRTTGNTYARSIAVGDPDADGVMEIMTSGHTDSGNTAELSIWSVRADFELSALPESRKIKPGRTTSYNLTITSINGFNSEVEFTSFHVRPIHSYEEEEEPPITFDPRPESVTPPAGGSERCILRVTTGEDIRPNIYEITITASSGKTTHYTSVNLTIAMCELFVEIDYMEGHEPNRTVLDYIRSYYMKEGTTDVTFVIDREIPFKSVITEAEFWACELVYNDKGDDKIIDGKRIYNSTWKWVLYVDTLKVHLPDCPRDIYPCGFCDVPVDEDEQMTRRLSTKEGNYILIADGLDDRSWPNHNGEVETVVLMHELGHSIGILKLTKDTSDFDCDKDKKELVEAYDPDPESVMSTVRVESVTADPIHYSEEYWAFRNMKNYRIDEN